MQIAQSASKKLGVLFRCRRFFYSEQLLQLYKGLIHPSMEYCSHIWGGSSSTYLLDKIKSKVIRIISSPNLLFLYIKHVTKGASEKRGGRGKHKTVRNRDIRISVEGRGMGRGTRGIQDGHHRDFQEEQKIHCTFSGRYIVNISHCIPICSTISLVLASWLGWRLGILGS